MSERVALVTLAVGEDFLARWRSRCEGNWQAYADRHGYDVLCLTEPLDRSARAASRSPAWQKCLVFGDARVRAYDRIVWVDADVLFNPAAPAIHAEVPSGRVGAVDEYASPSRAEHRRTIELLHRHYEALGSPHFPHLDGPTYYERWGLPGRFEEVVQTGVLVLDPSHRALLESVYARYEDQGPGLNYEMRPLSWELLDAGLVHWLDYRFNVIWGSHKARHHPHLVTEPDHPSRADAVTEALHEVYALHFAGGSIADMPYARDEPPGRSGGGRERVPRPAGPAPSRALEAPVALAVFGRPDLTARVLDAIRAAGPQRLLVFADAARPDVPGESARGAEVLELVERARAWCDVELELAPRHLGIWERMRSGLDWVFSRTEAAIVLEDDCLANASFFAFCDELLVRFRDDDRVMAVCGVDYQRRDDPPAASYRFSRYAQVWGWATWRRAWERRAGVLDSWPQLRAARWLDEVFDDPSAVSYWTYLFEETFRRREHWDYEWLLTCMRNDGLSVHPNRNLVSNLGFRDDATHTALPDGLRSPFAAVPAQELDFPLVHPAAVVPDPAADAFLEHAMYSGNLRRTFAHLRAGRDLRTAPGDAVTRVLHILPGAGVGGAPRAMRAVAEALDELEHRVVSLREADPRMRAELAAAGLAPVEAPDPGTLRALISAADLVHLHVWNTPELQELLHADWPPARVVGWGQVSGEAAPQRLPVRLADVADVVVGGLAVSGGPARTILPLAGTRPPAEPPHDRRSEELVVGYLGTVGPAKLHPRFVAMCAAVSAPATRFVVGGTGDGFTAIAREAEALGRRDAFDLRGYVEDVAAFFAELDVFGYPLCAETYAAGELVVQEAMHAGVPPVVLAHGGPAALVRDGVSGIVASDERAWTRALERLAADEPLRRRLGAGARAQAEREWSPSATADAWREVYAEALASPRRPRAAAPHPPRTGAQWFLAGLGDAPEPFATSHAATDPEAWAPADAAVARAPAVTLLADGGVLDFRRRHPADPHLRLWAGLLLGTHGRRVFAAGELAAAAQLGLPAERVAPHLDAAREALAVAP